MARMLVCSASSETMSSTAPICCDFLPELEHVADDQVDLAADAGDRLVRLLDRARRRRAPPSAVCSAICATRCALSAIWREVASSSLIVVRDLAHRRRLLLGAGGLLVGRGLQLGRRALHLADGACRSGWPRLRVRAATAIGAARTTARSADHDDQRWRRAAAVDDPARPAPGAPVRGATKACDAARRAGRGRVDQRRRRGTTASSGASVRRSAITCSSARWWSALGRSMRLEEASARRRHSRARVRPAMALATAGPRARRSPAESAPRATSRKPRRRRLSAAAPLAARCASMSRWASTVDHPVLARDHVAQRVDADDADRDRRGPPSRRIPRRSVGRRSTVASVTYAPCSRRRVQRPRSDCVRAPRPGRGSGRTRSSGRTTSRT